MIQILPFNELKDLIRLYDDQDNVLVKNVLVRLIRVIYDGFRYIYGDYRPRLMNLLFTLVYFQGMSSYTKGA